MQYSKLYNHKEYHTSHVFNLIFNFAIHRNFSFSTLLNLLINITYYLLIYNPYKRDKK